MNQYLTNYIVAVPARPDFDSYPDLNLDFSTYYLNLIVPTMAISTTLLDGANVLSASFTAIGSSGYSGAQFPVAPGTHTVNSSQGIEVRVYGWSDSDKSDAYGYFGGVSQ
jgi:hypothetical protein